VASLEKKEEGTGLLEGKGQGGGGRSVLAWKESPFPRGKKEAQGCTRERELKKEIKKGVYVVGLLSSGQRRKKGEKKGNALRRCGEGQKGVFPVRGVKKGEVVLQKTGLCSVFCFEEKRDFSAGTGREGVGLFQGKKKQSSSSIAACSRGTARLLRKRSRKLVRRGGRIFKEGGQRGHHDLTKKGGEDHSLRDPCCGKSVSKSDQVGEDLPSLVAGPGRREEEGFADGGKTRWKKVILIKGADVQQRKTPVHIPPKP